MTKDELKATLTMRDILHRNGINVNRNGFIPCPFHVERTASMKIYDDSFHCFGCGATGDIFDMEMHLNGCDFRTAFELLGGTEKPSWRATVMANKARKVRSEAEQIRSANAMRMRGIQLYITVYRNVIAAEPPFSDLWCYCIDKLQYQVYLLETVLELDK